MSRPVPELDIVVPVYNEAATIAGTLRAIFAVVSPLATHRFVVVEDRGTDGTREVLQALQAELVITMSSADHRRGYTRALKDGLLMTGAPFVLCIDGDGQFDPADIVRLWALRDEADIVSGCRVDRAEGIGRRFGSRLFGAVLRTAFPIPAKDPSSSLVLMRRAAVERLWPQVGFLPEAFWWEFRALAHRSDCSSKEMAVRHYPRSTGTTQIFTAARMPGVIWRQARGLVRLLKSPR